MHACIQAIMPVHGFLPPSPPLLGLPPELLGLILSQVDGGGSGALRLTCSALRQAVDAHSTALTWRGPPCRSATLMPLCLAAVLPASCRTAGNTIVRLDCTNLCAVPDDLGLGPVPEILSTSSGPLTLQPGITPRLRLKSLQGCPANVRELVCSGSELTELGPLAACTALQSLDCSKNRIKTLGPVVKCTGLRVLRCNNSDVADLRPLAPCRGLQVSSALCFWSGGPGSFKFQTQAKATPKFREEFSVFLGASYQFR